MNDKVERVINQIQKHNANYQLSLSDFRLTDGDILTLIPHLKARTDIKRINFAANEISDVGAKALAGCDYLELSLSFNLIGDDGARELSYSTSLTSLYLACNKITTAGVMPFANNTKLVNLVLSFNKIDGDQAAIKIAQGCQSLVCLSLSGSKIGDLGALALSRHTTLTELHLSNNIIESLGILALAGKSNLRILDLSNNLIADLDVGIIAKSTSIQDLDLDGNLIGDVAGQSLLRNKILMRVSLEETHISKQVKAELAEAVKLNKKNNEGMFINHVVELAKGSRANQPLHRLSSDIILIICSYVAINAGFKPQDVAKVCQFLQQAIRGSTERNLNWKNLADRSKFFRKREAKELAKLESRFPTTFSARLPVPQLEQQQQQLPDKPHHNYQA